MVVKAVHRETERERFTQPGDYLSRQVKRTDLLVVFTAAEEGA